MFRYVCQYFFEFFTCECFSIIYECYLCMHTFDIFWQWSCVCVHIHNSFFILRTWFSARVFYVFCVCWHICSYVCVCLWEWGIVFVWFSSVQIGVSICTYVYVCVWRRVCCFLSVYAYVSVYVYLCSCDFVCASYIYMCISISFGRICVYLFICLNICFCIDVSVYMCVRNFNLYYDSLYACNLVCVFVCVFV